MLNTAPPAATNAPIPQAAAKPRRALPVSNETTNAVIAPSKIVPSSDRLIKPAFSVIVSPRVASRMGAAPATTPDNNNTRFKSIMEKTDPPSSCPPPPPIYGKGCQHQRSLDDAA